MTLVVRRAGDHRPSPWRNGAGTTREVLSRRPWFGGAAFDWRISLAEVIADGPFSAFPDVDRTLVLVDGPRLGLSVDGARHELRPHRPFRFDGAAETACDVPAGPVLALNVMTRRGRFRAEVDVLDLSGSRHVPAAGATPLVLVVLTGALTVEDPDGRRADLRALDAVVWTDPATDLPVRGAGTAAAVRCHACS